MSRALVSNVVALVNRYFKVAKGETIDFSAYEEAQWVETAEKSNIFVRRPSSLFALS